jgi:hypothetical protein
VEFNYVAIIEKAFLLIQELESSLCRVFIASVHCFTFAQKCAGEISTERKFAFEAFFQLVALKLFNTESDEFLNS